MATHKGRILCSEDDADTRELIVMVLSQNGYEVTATESAEEALRIAKAEIFDLFLVDSWMPGVTGTELCQALRKFNVKTPILFYSGAACESDKAAARLAGAQGYLVKPVDNDEFVAEVARLIADSKIVKPVAVLVP